MKQSFTRTLIILVTFLSIFLVYPRFGFAVPATDTPDPTPTLTPTASREFDRCDCSGICVAPVNGTCGSCTLVRSAVCVKNVAEVRTPTATIRLTATAVPTVTGTRPATPTRTNTSTYTPTPTPTGDKQHDRCDCGAMCVPPVKGKCGGCSLIRNAACVGDVAATYTPTPS